jgi:hypothetical protein
LGINKKTGYFWWLQIPKPQEDPPDMRAMILVPDNLPNRNILAHREVEIVEITTYTTDSIDASILKKLNNKAYIRETCLLVCLSRVVYIPNVREIAVKLNNKISAVSDIWVLSSTDSNSKKYILFSLYPTVEVINFDLHEEISKIPTGDQLEMSRSKGTEMINIENITRSKFVPE